MRAVLVLLLLAACVPPPPPPPPPVVPVVLQVCPAGTPAPHAPGAPRTMKQFVDWTIDVYTAMLQTERARADCAERLLQLNRWIAQHQSSLGEPQDGVR